MLEPPRHLSLAPLAALLLACSAAPDPAPKAPAPDADGKLKAATQTHDELAKDLTAAPQDILAHCRTTSGDCLISVAERREALVSQYYLNPCRDADPEQQGPCVEHELEKRAERAALASFYETENWCSRKLLECISTFQTDAEQMAIRQRAQERREQVEAAPESAAAARAPEFSKERLAFVRSILPPKAQAACTPTAPAACMKKLKAPSAELDNELARAPDAYDAKRALALYASLRQAEADCSKPELQCLLDGLAQNGGSAETDKLLKQNLDLVTQQQKLRLSVDPDAAEQCLTAGVTQYGSRIVSAYQAYAGDPTTALLLKLQKAFVPMHQAQLWCLMPLAKSGKR